MTLRLFTVFHGNLDFSALPDRDLPLVIARCYWPLLSLAEQYRIPLGIEMPARTLRRLADEDPEWLKAFRTLADRGLVEPVASGWSQVVSPLAPVDVNRANFALGRKAYEELLGEAPSTWFVNEQVFAQGLTDLYVEVGATSLVMEWNNPATHRPELRPLRFRPSRLASSCGGTLRLLWNDCIFFQKVQRVAQGLCPSADLSRCVAEARERKRAQALCVYGGDIEIFDYRPGHENPADSEDGIEMQRLGSCLRALAAEPGNEFRLPRDVASDLEEGPVVELASAADPLPCKKQPRYNPTRWSVSGRDGFGMNTQCFALRRCLRTLSHLDPGRAQGDLDSSRTQVELWGSDFRTRATEEKVRAFQAGMGSALSCARAALEESIPQLSGGAEILLVNASDECWDGDPVQVELRFPPGRQCSRHVIAEPLDSGTSPSALPGASQLEVSSLHRDGSVRSATLVLEPHIERLGRLALRLRAVTAAVGGDGSAGSLPELRTDAVIARFLEHRGGAIEELRFPAVSAAPLVGTVPHGSFDPIEYTPDFYTGHVVAIEESAEKATDLVRVVDAQVREAGAVRATIEFRTATRCGEWAKIYHIYRNQPRLDLVHVLRFHEARIRSLRLGIVTVSPDAFARESLAFSSVNGALHPDSFRLTAESEIHQHRSPSPAVSATSCLGATEGWVSVGDAEKGIAVITDRSQAAAVPLMEYAEVDGRPFLRIHHSVAETDETRATFFRGVLRVGFSIIGHRADLSQVRNRASAIERGLAFRTENDCGIARSL